MDLELPDCKKSLVACGKICLTRNSYWDPPSTLVAEQNNWADYLVNEGYSVFNFDRLGVHRSTR